MNVICSRSIIGVFCTVDGQLVTVGDSLAYVKHSPDGFEMGYSGAGPAQLAFAILLHARGHEFALEHYQAFKEDFVAQWHSDEINVRVDLDTWLQNRK